MSEIGANSADARHLAKGVRPRAKATDETLRQIFVGPHGFGPMVRITTAMGPVYAQTLREGDRVKTKTGEFLRIMAIKRILLDGEFLSRHPGAQPILLRAGSLAMKIPTVDILLAPNQKIHAIQAISDRNCRKAIDALRKPGVVRKAESMFTYTTFHCGKPAAVLCEGLWLDTAP